MKEASNIKRLKALKTAKANKIRASKVNNAVHIMQSSITKAQIKALKKVNGKKVKKNNLHKRDQKLKGHLSKMKHH